jgi:hypothetical protein
MKMRDYLLKSSLTAFAGGKQTTPACKSRPQRQPAYSSQPENTKNRTIVLFFTQFKG